MDYFPEVESLDYRVNSCLILRAISRLLSIEVVSFDNLTNIVSSSAFWPKKHMSKFWILDEKWYLTCPIFKFNPCICGFFNILYVILLMMLFVHFSIGILIFLLLGSWNTLYMKEII
jgi:hypothetical protein